MSEDFLYSQLFSQPNPQTADKKDTNADILNSLYQLDLPAPKKKEPEIKKNKHQDEIHHYISSTNKNTIPPLPPKSKQHQTQKAGAASKKSTSASHQVKSSTAKPVERVQDKKESKYMPTVVDIFAKKEDKSAKTKPVVQKSDSYQVRPKEKKSKVQAKKDKIERKQLQNNNKAKKNKPAGRPQSQDKYKKQLMKEKAVLKDRSHKKKQKSSESSSSSSSSSSPSPRRGRRLPQQQRLQDWQIQMRKYTGYNPNDIKYRERDRMVIEQSGVDRIFGEDKFSYRMGRKQQEEDMRLQQQQRLRKLKQQHRDRR